MFKNDGMAFPYKIFHAAGSSGAGGEADDSSALETMQMSNGTSVRL
jgi:hypothetical protein